MTCRITLMTLFRLHDPDSFIDNHLGISIFHISVTFIWYTIRISFQFLVIRFFPHISLFFSAILIIEFVINILEGAISGKKTVERPQLQYLQQVARNTGADGYIAMKRMACNKSRWKATNQSEDWNVRRYYLYCPYVSYISGSVTCSL
jgi:hypothetical protein